MPIPAEDVERAETAPRTQPYAWALIAAAAVAGLSAPFAGAPALTLGLLAAAAVALGLAIVLLTAPMRAARRKHRLMRAARRLARDDLTPWMSTDLDGALVWQNKAAERLYPVSGETTLTALLRGVFADPAALVLRLRVQAARNGAAREDVVVRKGQVRVSVHLVPEAGYLWRLDSFGAPLAAGRGSEGIAMPMMTVSKTGTILYMNDAMRRFLGRRATTLDRIFSELPVRPGQVNEVAASDGPAAVLVAVVAGPSARDEMYFLPAPAASAIASSSDWPLLERLPVAMLHLSLDGTVRMANRAARVLLSDPVAPGTRFDQLVEGAGRALPIWLKDAADGRAAGRSEVLRAKHPQKELHLQITLQPMEDGGDRSLVAVLLDATELKSLEAQFVQSQKMQAIGQLAGGVAHDFNNLLTAIRGHCDLLMLRHDAGDPDYGDLVQISQNANRAAALVGQLLAFSRKQTLQAEVFDLRNGMADLVHLLNRLVGEKVTLTVRHHPKLKPVCMDKRQLEQVMMNLVVNARDAMPDGGEVQITTDMVTLRSDMQRDRATVPAGEYVLVRVTDRGIGIPEVNLPKLFEPFFTTKNTGEGTGLGLSTVYGIVKQTGGYIFVDSEPGSGTCFSLYFPAQEAVVEPAPAAAPAPQAPHRAAPAEGGVVLLVEDEAPVRAFASCALRLRGYTVLEAESAEQALQTLSDEALDVDVFVTDVIMPGMDGPSWVRAARERRPDVRVVFVSGYAEESFAADQASIPNSVFLPKPFSLSELTETVQSVLH